VKAAAFEYVRAGSVEEACASLAQHGSDARLIAGGQSLVPMMAMRIVRPSVLIDIDRLGELKGIGQRDGALVIGAGTRQQTVKEDELAASRVPLLRHALRWVGHVQTRNRGTVGGSLAHADPSAELPLVAQVLEAGIVLRSVSTARTVPSGAFFIGPMQTAIGPTECLSEIHWPIWGDSGVGCAFEEVSARNGDFAFVAATAQVQTDDAGRCTRAAFGLGGVDGKPLAFPRLALSLVGTKLVSSDIDAVADGAAGEIDPGDDLHASADYRRHLARVLVARVLGQARDRSRAAERRG
jgi:CO/xanthine dehydrogenase FAD-binding subunit